MEQTEVEAYFIKQGYLLPKYHQSYWMGLRATQWPNFAWIDNTVRKTSYQHWGQYPDGSREPKSRQNTCGAGSYALADEEAWGWSAQSCSQGMPYMCRIIQPGNITIPSNVTGNVFTLMTIQVNQARAQALCNDIGGHLASYVSLDEQSEMEYAFINSGHLVPSFHKTYWMGLATTQEAWPAFRWLDRNVPTPEQGYSHWGVFQFDGFSSPEPNNWEMGEYCTMANYTERFGGPLGWGWSDVPCTRTAVLVCRRLRKWP
jgi:hypothetical protein